MFVNPAYVSAKKSKGAGTGNGEFDSGYRAGVAKAAEDVGKFNANQLNGVDALGLGPATHLLQFEIIYRRYFS